MNAIKQKIEAAREALHVLDDALIEVANLTKDLPKPPDQSREEYFADLEAAFECYVEANDKENEMIYRESILALSFDRIRELEMHHSKLQQAYSQYLFFMDGYRNGSASISEVNAAQSEFLILLNGNDN